jgi:NADH dehydrogenase/NADH:ubiquinone oxidoreductase subunit G
MKKSELKEYIKEAIIAELTEDMKGAVELPIGTAASAIKKYTDQNIDVELTKEAKKAQGEDDVEDDEEKLDKKAQAAAKKGGGKVGKLQRVTAQLKELEKEMKEIVGKWKKAEGKEKETLLDKLKEKTKVKKELEALEDKLADAIV